MGMSQLLARSTSRGEAALAWLAICGSLCFLLLEETQVLNMSLTDLQAVCSTLVIDWPDQGSKKQEVAMFLQLVVCFPNMAGLVIF